MESAFWAWCVRTRNSAYAANEEFDGPDSISAGPCWCFDRMGQAYLVLPDGRTVHIAGEHEDHYDPDFYIYNDVVIVDGEHIRILGYPELVFTPTDFHTATLVDKEIFIIGNLGYVRDRIPGKTQVFRLDTVTWRLAPLKTIGTSPGWIHNHMAVISAKEDGIIVSGGKVYYGERILENLADYRLSFQTLAWTKIADREWERWILERKDGEANRLWEIRSAAWHRELGVSVEEHLRETLTELPNDAVSELVPKATDEQIAQIASLYKSPFADALAISDVEHYGRYTLDVQGTTVRFDEDMYNIIVTVEGQLSSNVANDILVRLQERLTKLENAAYTVTRVDESGATDASKSH